MGHLIVVDDEVLLRRSLAYNLEQSGYRVSSAGRAEDALGIARRDPPDLVLLDIGLPGMDGLQALREFRQEIGCPVIFVTARRRELDEQLGLELGADDYLAKPFNTRELIARIRAVLRRSSKDIHTPDRDIREIRAGTRIRINISRRTVFVDDKEIDTLTAKEFDILLLLVKHPGQIYTREDLIRLVWGYDYVGEDRTVDVHIRRLRDKIEPDPAHPRFIQTKWGVGYFFQTENKL